MHWKKLMTKVAVGAWDLFEDDGKGKRRPIDRTGVITKVEGKVWRTGPGQPPLKKVTISLASSSGKAWPKVFIANTTNCTTIEQMYGAEVEGWIGKKISLYPDKTRDPKKRGTVMVDCVRVRNMMPKNDADELVPQDVDEQMLAAQESAFGMEE